MTRKVDPLVSILIVTHNSAPYLMACLKSLIKITYPKYEIIIVDNASTDETVSIIESIKSNNILLIKNSQNKGYAAANNQAAAKAHGSYLFILNPDTIVDSAFLEPLVACSESNPKTAVCQPLVLLFDKKTINLTGKVTHFLGFDWIRDYRSTTIPVKSKLYSCSGSGFLIRTNVFATLGGFDKHYFMYYEDSDLSWRLQLAGFNIYFIPESKLYHDYKYIPNEEYQPLKQKLFYIERNRLMTVLKNYSLKTLILIFPLSLSVELGLLLLATSQGWGMTKLKTYKSLIQQIPYLLSERKRISALRIKSDAYLVRHCESQITFEKFAPPIVRKIINPFLKIYYQGLLKFL
jgi:GT2 family glycosyltransferase